MKTTKNSEAELRNIVIAQDKYNTENLVPDPNLYTKIIHFEHDFTPNQGEELTEYAFRLKLHLQHQIKFNENTHMNGPKGPWYTHRNPMGCFACQDVNFMNAVTSAIQYLSKRYPNLSF